MFLSIAEAPTVPPQIVEVEWWVPTRRSTAVRRPEKCPGHGDGPPYRGGVRATAPLGEQDAGDRSFAALASLVRAHAGIVVLTTVLRVVGSVLPVLHPYFLARLATSVDRPDRARHYLVLLFVTGAVHGVLWSGNDFLVSARISPLTYELKRLAYDTVWSEDCQRFVDRPSGKVASYVNDLRGHVDVLFDTAHYGFLPLLSAVPAYVVLLWQAGAGASLAYGIFLVGAGGVLTAAMGPVNDRQRRLTDATATNNGRVFDSYANFVNVFSFRAQAKELRRNDGELEGLVGDEVRFRFALSAYWGVAAFLVRVVLWAGVMGFSWYQYDRGRIGFVAMVVSITVLLDFTNQYWNVVHNLGQWIDRSAAYREAYTYLFPGRDIVADPPPPTLAPSPAPTHTPPPTPAPGRSTVVARPSAPPTAAAPPERVRLTDALEVRDLCFAYPDEPGRLALDGISFRVARGEHLGIVGRSGEGKSTLIKILLGFYAPTSGQVRVDGRVAAPGDLNRLQAYVPQDTSLFQETIEYNIGYAVPGPVDPARIREAARRAHIADFVESLPDGYRTLVGERGIKLSLGQRQRIAIARAFLTDADLVILDEATSALDSETEARIQEGLDELWAGRAAIVIAHRLATLNHVDRILVIDEGRVVQQGTKDELLRDGGLFADLWEVQQAGML